MSEETLPNRSNRHRKVEVANDQGRLYEDGICETDDDSITPSEYELSPTNPINSFNSYSDYIDSDTEVVSLTDDDSYVESDIDEIGISSGDSHQLVQDGQSSTSNVSGCNNIFYASRLKQRLEKQEALVHDIRHNVYGPPIDIIDSTIEIDKKVPKEAQDYKIYLKTKNPVDETTYDEYINTIRYLNDVYDFKNCEPDKSTTVSFKDVTPVIVEGHFVVYWRRCIDENPQLSSMNFSFNHRENVMNDILIFVLTSIFLNKFEESDKDKFIMEASMREISGISNICKTKFKDKLSEKIEHMLDRLNFQAHQKIIILDEINYPLNLPTRIPANCKCGLIHRVKIDAKSASIAKKLLDVLSSNLYYKYDAAAIFDGYTFNESLEKLKFVQIEAFPHIIFPSNSNINIGYVNPVFDFSLLKKADPVDYKGVNINGLQVQPYFLGLVLNFFHNTQGYLRRSDLCTLYEQLLHYPNKSVTYICQRIIFKKELECIVPNDHYTSYIPNQVFEASAKFKYIFISSFCDFRGDIINNSFIALTFWNEEYDLVSSFIKLLQLVHINYNYCIESELLFIPLNRVILEYSLVLRSSLKQ